MFFQRFIIALICTGLLAVHLVQSIVPSLERSEIPTVTEQPSSNGHGHVRESAEGAHETIRRLATNLVSSKFQCIDFTILGLQCADIAFRPVDDADRSTATLQSAAIRLQI